jgi:hypothetical protein
MGSRHVSYLNWFNFEIELYIQVFLLTGVMGVSAYLRTAKTENRNRSEFYKNVFKNFEIILDFFY